jgi:hypothetical protein
VTALTGAPITRIERVGLIAALVLAACLMWPLRGYLTDDTFIHLRYAEHLSRGEGLVFNPGERVYGCTSPLWVALLADGMALGLDGVWTAKILGAIATFASIGLFLQLMRRTLVTPAVRALATVAWGGHAWMARWAMSGMETPLAVALVLAGFVAFTEGKEWGSRPIRTGTLWALGALTRPEVGFLLGLWGIFLIADAENRAGIRRLVFGSLPPLVIYGGWLAFARVYFGSFLPQTLTAKAAGSGGPGFSFELLQRQLAIIASTEGVLVLVLALALVFGGSRVIPGRLVIHRVLPWAWVVAIPVLYVARGVPVISRYLLPLMPVIAWLAWRAVEAWWRGAAGDAPRRRVVVLGAVLAAAVLAQNAVVYQTRVRPHVADFTAGLESSLVHWGRWFRDHTPAGATIASPDIGAIGYFSKRRVIDLAGLVSPGMVPLLEQETPERISEEFLFASVARPDFLVDRAPRGQELTRRSRFAACLVKLGESEIDGLGIARPGTVVYTFYRIDWACADTVGIAAPITRPATH